MLCSNQLSYVATVVRAALARPRRARNSPEFVVSSQAGGDYVWTDCQAVGPPRFFSVSPLGPVDGARVHCGRACYRAPATARLLPRACYRESIAKQTGDKHGKLHTMGRYPLALPVEDAGAAGLRRARLAALARPGGPPAGNGYGPAAIPSQEAPTGGQVSREGTGGGRVPR